MSKTSRANKSARDFLAWCEALRAKWKRRGYGPLSGNPAELALWRETDQAKVHEAMVARIQSKRGSK